MAVDLILGCNVESLAEPESIFCRITNRGGSVVLMEFEPDLDSYFERQLDTYSLSEVTFTSESDCCDDVNMITVGMDLEWWINDVLVWGGPIINATFTGNAVSIRAADVSVWWHLRKATDLNLVDIDSTRVVKALHEMAMADDPVPGFELFITPSNEDIDFRNYTEEYVTCGELIDEIADYSVDYTTIGRKVYVGGADFLPQLPFYLSDADFIDPPTVEARGPLSGFATRIIIRGGSGKTATATAKASILATYGLIDKIVDLDHIVSQDDLEKAARSHLAISSSPYYINFSNGQSVLAFGAALSLRLLIPGTRFFFETSEYCKKLRAEMRLVSARVKGNGEVSIALEPLGETVDV